MIRTIHWEVVDIETLIDYLSDRYDDSPDIICSAIMVYNSSSFVRITKEVLEAYIDFENFIMIEKKFITIFFGLLKKRKCPKIS